MEQAGVLRGAVAARRPRLTRRSARAVGTVAVAAGFGAASYGVAAAATAPSTGQHGLAVGASSAPSGGYGTWGPGGPWRVLGGAGVAGTVSSVNGSSASGTCGSGGTTGSFTVQSRAGTTYTVEVTGSTKFYAPGSSSASFAGVCVGGRAAAAGSLSGTTVTAARVALLPAGSPFAGPGGGAWRFGGRGPWAGGGPGPCPTGAGVFGGPPSLGHNRGPAMSAATA